MRPREHASEGPSGTEGSAGQSPALVAVAPAQAQTAPDGDAGSQAGQSGAVWDQPLPWATPGEGDENPSTEQPGPEQPTSAQAEPLEAQESPTPEAAAAPDEGGEGATDADDAPAAGTDSSVELWQAAVSEQQRGAHAAPAAASLAGAAGGHTVSRWLLGVAVAAGGLLAAVGVSEGLGSHRSAATAKDHPLPLVGPGQGLGAAGSPTPTPTPPTTKKPTKGLIAAGTGKAGAVLPPGVALAATDPEGGHTPASAKTADSAPQRVTTKASTTGQSSYLSVQTSVQSPNDYWSQSSLTVRTTKKLTALKVVLHVAQTGGVANTGVWTSLGDKVTVHTGRASDGGADYVVVLNAGITLDAGSYVFQFQYNHDKGARDMVHDIWGVVTTAVGDSKEEYQNGRY